MQLCSVTCSTQIALVVVASLLLLLDAEGFTLPHQTASSSSSSSSSFSSSLLHYIPNERNSETHLLSSDELNQRWRDAANNIQVQYQQQAPQQAIPCPPKVPPSLEQMNFNAATASSGLFQQEQQQQHQEEEVDIYLKAVTTSSETTSYFFEPLPSPATPTSEFPFQRMGRATYPSVPPHQQSNSAYSNDSPQKAGLPTYVHPDAQSTSGIVNNHQNVPNTAGGAGIPTFVVYQQRPQQEQEQQPSLQQMVWGLFGQQ